MAPAKRSSEAPSKRSRRSKKARKVLEESPEPILLGSTSLSSRPQQKDQEELDLEEAVFGRSTDAQDGLWDLAEEDLGKGKGKMRAEDLDSDDEEDLEETGLERLKDDNVRSFPPNREESHKSSFMIIRFSSFSSSTHLSPLVPLRTQ